MAKLTAVDFNPFESGDSQTSPSSRKLTPVDFNPFEQQPNTAPDLEGGLTDFERQYSLDTNQPDESAGDSSIMGDLAVSYGVGSNNLLKTVGGLYGLATGNMDNWATRQGESGRDYWNRKKSEALKSAEERRDSEISSADGELAQFGTAVWETIKDPRLLASFITEQAPMTVGPGGLGRAAGVATKAAGGSTKAAIGAGVGTAIGAGAALQGADVGESTYREIMDLPEEIWLANPEYSNLRQEIGADKAKHELALRYGRLAGTASGALSVATQAIPGAATLEKLLGKGENFMPGGVLARVAKGAAGEGLQESIEEGGGQAISNIGISGIDPSREVTEGVGAATGLGLVGGGVMGGAAGLLSGRAKAESAAQGGNEIDQEIAGANAILDAADTLTNDYGPININDLPVSPDSAPIGPEAGQGLTAGIDEYIDLASVESIGYQAEPDLPPTPATAARQEEVKKQGLSPRFAGEGHRAGVQKLISDLTPGGGSAVLPDGSRSPSLNPEWFKGEDGALGSVNYVQEAVKKALNGEKLGKKQARIVEILMDEYEIQADEDMNQGVMGVFDPADDLSWFNEKGQFLFRPEASRQPMYFAELEEDARRAGVTEEEIVGLIRQNLTLPEHAEALYGLTKASADRTQAGRPQQSSYGAPQAATVPQSQRPGGEEQAIDSEAQQGIGGQEPQGLEPEPNGRNPVQRNIFKDRIEGIDDPQELRDYISALRTSAMTDERTGLGSNKAWVERDPKRYTAAIDLDSLKWVNDNMGHAAGDEMIRLAGAALKGFGGNAFHVSGDEFYVQADSQEELDAGLKQAQDWLRGQTVTSGDQSYKGPGFSYGIGDNPGSAESLLQANKSAREQAGERAARGETPPGAMAAKPNIRKGRDDKYGVDVELEETDNGYIIRTSDENQKDKRIEYGLGGVYLGDLVLNIEGDFVDPKNITQAGTGTQSPEKTPFKGSNEVKKELIKLVSEMVFASEVGDTATAEKMESAIFDIVNGRSEKTSATDAPVTPPTPEPQTARQKRIAKIAGMTAKDRKSLLKRAGLVQAGEPQQQAERISDAFEASERLSQYETLEGFINDIHSGKISGDDIYRYAQATGKPNSRHSREGFLANAYSIYHWAKAYADVNIPEFTPETQARKDKEAAEASAKVKEESAAKNAEREADYAYATEHRDEVDQYWSSATKYQRMKFLKTMLKDYGATDKQLLNWSRKDGIADLPSSATQFLISGLRKHWDGFDKGTTAPVKSTEAELVDEDDLEERTRADMAGESPDRASLIVVREFLESATDVMNGEDLGENTTAAIGLIQSIAKALDGKGDLTALNVESADFLNELANDTATEDDVGYEARRIAQIIEAMFADKVTGTPDEWKIRRDIEKRIKNVAEESGLEAKQLKSAPIRRIIDSSDIPDSFKKELIADLEQANIPETEKLTGAVPQPKWWTDKTKAERSRILAGAGIKTYSEWGSLSEDEQQFLSEQWDTPTTSFNILDRPPPTGKPKEPEKPKSEASDYGSKNTLVTKDRAEELRKKLKAKLGQLNAGIDPEMLAMGAELAVFHIEAGVRKFSDLAKTMADDLGTDIGKIRPYLRSWYNGARDMMEDSGLSVEGMDTPDQVKAALAKMSDQPQESGLSDTRQSLSDYLGDRIDTLVDNRVLKSALAEYHGIAVSEVDDKLLKEAQEALELALVRQARETVRNGIVSGKKESAIYDSLVDQYNNQPNLNVRSSTSTEKQAYSTPSPIAFLSSKLAGITTASTVYEPTAGNGMLLIGASVDNSTVNELDNARADNLKALGFTVTNKDATGYAPPTRHDAVIMNPPFGTMKRPVKVDGFTIKKIDHLIAAKALESMKDDGRSVLIIGASKNAGEIGAGDRVFFNWLYSHYNVVDHFEVDGDLYRRQGAGWPIRILTVDGRQESKTMSPPSGSIERLDNWNDIYEHYETVKQVLGAKSSRPEPGGESGIVVENDTIDSGPGQGSNAVENANPDRGDGSATNSGRNETESGDAQPGTTSSVTNGSVRNPNVGGGTGGTDGSGGRKTKKQESGPKITNLEGSKKPDSTRVDANPSGKKLVGGGASEFQTAYIPKSKGFNDSVLMPKNMADAIHQAMADIAGKVGDIDAYVMDKLGYKSLAELHDSFMALQVDAIAAQIHNVEEKQKGIIIADQTGVGKGRQAAGIIRYAIKQGKIPIFMTVKPNLYSDMYGDLLDIKFSEIDPFITNQGEAINYEGESYFRNTGKGYKDKIETIIDTGQLPGTSNAIFTTYDQLNTENPRREAIRRIVDGGRAFFVLDESHNAAGEFVKVSKVDGVNVERLTAAGFVSDMLKSSDVVYLSATYAKRPDNMPLYHKTDLLDAVDSSQELIDAMASGGVPLQQVASNLLAQSGQLFRRERSFEGISIPMVVDTDTTAYQERMSDTVNEGLSSIVMASETFIDVFMEDHADALFSDGEGVSIAGNRADGAAVSANPFTSVVHNNIRQLLLGLKVKTAAEHAIKLHKSGVKPVIALENTMGSMLQDYIKSRGLKEGDKIDFSYRDIMLVTLERTRRVSVRDSMGDSEAIQVEMYQLDPLTRAIYENAEDVINRLDFSDIPASPIDYIMNEMRKANMSVDEITGRQWAIDYSGSYPTVTKIPPKNANKRKSTIDGFNSGTKDSLILNVAGATGLSIHASEKFKDTKPRHMIVAQPMLDINILMQMLGRINRTGQVELPQYTLMALNIPAEKRPIAITMRKLAKLNANTSSNDKSDTSFEAPDFMNKYGDEVVNEWLLDNPEIAARTSIAASDRGPFPDIAAKFTGRLSLETVEVQRQVFEEILQLYNDKIEYLNSVGQNDLVAQTLDMDAYILESKVVYEGKAAGLFGGDTTLHKVNAKYQGKPPLPDEVEKELTRGLGGMTPESKASKILDKKEKDKRVPDSWVSRRSELEKELAKDKRNLEKAKEGGDQEKIGKAENHVTISENRILKLEKEQDDFARQKAQVIKLVGTTFKVGNRVRLVVDDESMTGVVVAVKDNHATGRGNPYALSKTRVTFMVNSGIRQFSLPLSKLLPDSDIFDRVVSGSGTSGLDQIFDPTFSDTERREVRYIATGNLFAGMSKLGGGRIISFTDREGKEHQGILMPKRYGKKGEFDRGNIVSNRVVRDAEVAANFLRAGGPGAETGLFSADKAVRVTMGRSGFIAIVPTANKNKEARSVKLDQELRDIIGDFYGRGKESTANIPDSKLVPAIARIMELIPLNISNTFSDQFEDAGGAPPSQAIASFDGKSIQDTSLAPEKGKAAKDTAATLATDEIAESESEEGLSEIMGGSEDGWVTIGYTTGADGSSLDISLRERKIVDGKRKTAVRQLRLGDNNKNAIAWEWRAAEIDILEEKDSRVLMETMISRFNVDFLDGAEVMGSLDPDDIWAEYGSDIIEAYKDHAATLPAEKEVAGTATQEPDTGKPEPVLSEKSYRLMDSEHTKTGKPLFVVNMTEDMGDNYTTLSNLAKKNNGFYIKARMRSYYKPKGGGIVFGTPTFTFDNEADRASFLFEASDASTPGLMFSKTKPGATPRGMTVKSAELAVNAWLKRFKGARPATIKVIRSQAEVTDSTMRVNAAYDTESDTLYIVAANIDSARDLTKVLQHELFIHKGLGLLNQKQIDDLYAMALGVSNKDKAVQALWNQIQEDYAGESNFVQAEELLAAMAEQVKVNSLTLGMRRILLFLRDLLKKVGFFRSTDKVSISEVHGMVLDLANRMRAGEVPDKRDIDKLFLQSAYHGTPHKFDKFSLSAIGSGEGAQLYGWGLYFAGKRAVAEWYRDTLGNIHSNMLLDGKQMPEEDIGQASIAYRIWRNADKKSVTVTRDDANVAFEQWLFSTHGIKKRDKNYRDFIKHNAAEEYEFVQSVVGREISMSGGTLYQVDIPEDNELLDRDKPLSEQSEIVKKAMKVFRNDKYDLNPDDGTDIEDGATAYARIAGALGSPELASKALSKAGIPGLRYYDQGSRNQPDRMTYQGKKIGSPGSITDPELLAASYVASYGDDAVSMLGYDKPSGRDPEIYEKAKLLVPKIDKSELGESTNYNYVIWDEDRVTVEAVNDELRQAETQADKIPDTALFSRRSQPDPELDELMSRLGLNKKEESYLKRQLDKIMGASFKDMTSRSYEGIFDGLYGIAQAEKKSGKGIIAGDYEGSGYVGARLATGVSDAMHAIMHRGVPYWSQGVLEHKPGTRGLLEVFGDLGPDLNDWLAWIAGHRAQELMDEGREKNLSQENIDYAKGLAGTGEKLAKFKRLHKEYADMNKAMLNMAEEAGLIKHENRQKWESPWYIPFYRQEEGGDFLLAPSTKKGLSHQTAGIKRLWGGETATNDLLENILTNWLKLTDSSMKNMALLKTVDNLKDTEFLTNESLKYTKAIVTRREMINRIKSSLESGEDDRRRLLKSTRGDVELALIISGEEDYTGMSDPQMVEAAVRALEEMDDSGFEQLWSITAPTDPKVIRVKRDGKNEYYRVEDDSLLRGLVHISNTGSNTWMMRGGRWFKRLLTTGITSSPDFIIRNLVRDTVHSWAISPDGFAFGKDTLKGLKGAITEEDSYWEMMFAGASFQGGYIHGTDPEAGAQMMRRALEKKGLNRRDIDGFMDTVIDSPDKLKRAMLQGWQHYRGFGDKIENANRLATFKAARKAGKSLAQAMYESKDLMDYSLRGNWAGMMVLTDLVPFLNARLQGLSKLVRAGELKGGMNPLKWRMRADVSIAMTKIALASVLLAMANDDEDRYKELEDWEKDAYWHIFLEGQHIRIPKPFEIGLLAGTIPERMYRTWVTDSQPNDKLLWAMQHGLMDTLSFNPVPQAALPLIELWGNKSWYFDTPIESSGDEFKLPRDRYNKHTSDAMVELGQLIGMSPKKLEHLWKGYTGTMGAYGLDTADMLVRAATGEPAKGEVRARDLPVIKSFYRGSADQPAYRSQYATDLYDRLEEVRQIHGSLRSKVGKERQELLKESQDKLRHKGMLDSAARGVSGLRKQMDLVISDKSLSKSQKQKRVDLLQRRMNRMQKQAAEMSEKDF